MKTTRAINKEKSKLTFPNHRKKYGSVEAFTAKDWNNTRGHTKKHKFPSKYIFAYMPYSRAYFLKNYKSKRVHVYCWLNVHIHKDIGFVLMSGPGAPYVGAILEELIALGGKYFINTGTAGGLKETGIIVCSKALKDEGTSHHYTSKGRYSYPNSKLTKLLKKTLEKNKIFYSEGGSWTTDAIYRETKAEIEKYKKEGLYTVEMEASALFTIGKIRKVKVASIFTVSDIPFHKKEEKFHRFDTKKGQRQLIDNAVECLKKLR